MESDVLIIEGELLSRVAIRCIAGLGDGVGIETVAFVCLRDRPTRHQGHDQRQPGRDRLGLERQ
jgi:hypothetical protein